MSVYPVKVARVLLGGALLVGLSACGNGESAEAEAAVEEDAIVLSEGDVQVAQTSEVAGGVVLTGSLQPYRIVEVKAQVPGIIGSLAVDRGDAVRQGQALASIEAAGIRGQAAGARAGVAAAQAQLALAQQQLESARTLYEAGAMAQLDFRAAQAAHESARAQLAAAEAQSAGAGEQARRATVTAPLTGEVSERQVNGGEAVSPGQSLFTVVSTEFLELAGQVPVDQAARVRPGQPAEFSLTAYPGQTFRGTVARVEPIANPETRQIGVYLRLANQNRALVGGLFATGRVLGQAGQSAVVVPAAAVRGSGNASYVWVIEDGVVAKRPVVTGARDDERAMVAISSGLSGGEQVVVAPGELREGARVRVGAEPAPAPENAAKG
jgi:membrane fusion protein, multidrug efflux system